jgi:Ca2+/Na+ antiporter
MKIKYTIREKDLLETQWLIASKSDTLRWRRWISIIFVTACLLAFCMYLDRCVQPLATGAVVIFILAIWLYIFLLLRIHRMHYAKQVKARFAKIIGNSVELQIADGYMETRDSAGEAKMKLTAIEKVYETGNLFVIQSCSSYLTIAKQDIDAAEFRDSLATHGLNVEIIREKVQC